MARLRVLVNEGDWAHAAENSGISRSRVSNLLRSKWDKFSLDMLITQAARAERKVKLTMA